MHLANSSNGYAAVVGEMITLAEPHGGLHDVDQLADLVAALWHGDHVTQPHLRQARHHGGVQLTPPGSVQLTQRAWNAPTLLHGHVPNYIAIMAETAMIESFSAFWRTGWSLTPWSDSA